mmetsp:Transcript_13430/g.11925  ORF Transcript_13430/g.11925 Transcript_13430/m.11925 type:complete len:111 (+) Transcript_13430:3-335(+)
MSISIFKYYNYKATNIKSHLPDATPENIRTDVGLNFIKQMKNFKSQDLKTKIQAFEDLKIKKGIDMKELEQHEQFLKSKCQNLLNIIKEKEGDKRLIMRDQSKKFERRIN